MSGTSLDAVDAALVACSEGLPPRLVHAINHPLPSITRKTIQQLSQPGYNEIAQLGQLDIQLGQLFAEAVNTLLAASDHSASQICAIGSHGQTVRHHRAGELAFTLQIGDPNTIAFRTGITTIADFRRMDIAAGGHGAPLVPAFHNAVLNNPNENRVIVNIGGMANVTSLAESTPVQGYDTGPGNVLMDGWIQKHTQQAYDADGAWAASGENNGALLSQLLSHPYFQIAPPKSTGRETFHLAWLETELSRFPNIRAQDVQRTLAELTAHSIAKAVTAFPDIRRVLLCGGGSHNRLLRERIKAMLPAQQHGTTTQFGVDADWLEAMAFAWLAQQRLYGMSGNIPAVTGATRPCVLGGIYSPT